MMSSNNKCKACQGDLHCFGNKAINLGENCNCDDCLKYLECKELEDDITR